MKTTPFPPFPPFPPFTPSSRRRATAAAFAGALAVAILSGCAALPAPPKTDAAAPAVQACRGWLQQLDEQVARFGVRDAQSAPLARFGHLRTERFEAALRERAAADEAAFQAWLQRLARLGATGQTLELQRLPEAGLAALGLTRAQAQAHAAHCRAVLLAADAQPGPHRATLLAQARVPDAYAVPARVLGLYALTRWPFSAGVQRWQRQTQARFEAVAAGQPAAGPLLRYGPMDPAEAQPGPDPAAALAAAPRDALGVPQPAPALLQRLLLQHAPVLELAQAGAYDEPGRALPLPGGGWTLDTSQPTLYTRVAHTLVQGQPALQLVYLAWFSERPPRGAIDLLAGRWDGLVWRVTLGADGRPLLYDSIHACGCYHLFFPTAALRPRPPPGAGIEWVFAPAPAPVLQPGQRVVLRLDSASHYLVGVRADEPRAHTGYQLREEDDLRAMPLLPPASATTSATAPWHSLYGPDGLLAGSERAERWFFWPMGVRSAGTQRQWGHHATAFVGRRHFDDADLIDRRFEPVP